MKNLILKFTSKSIRIVLFAWLFCSGILFAQDSSQYKSIWENYIWDFGEMESKPMGYSFCNMNWTAYSDKIVHYPDSDDTLLVQENKALCSTHPNDSNYILFYDVAHSNWKINNRQIAKSMLLQIVNFMDEFYTSDY